MAIKTFTTGEVLTASDTNTYLANSGLVYITADTLSSAATDFIGCFSSTYDHYRILINRATLSAATDLCFQMLSGTTPATTNAYYSGYVGLTSTGASLNQVNQATNPGRLGGGSNDPGSYIDISLDIFNPFLANTTQLTIGAAFFLAGGYGYRNGGATHAVNTSYNGIRILSAGGQTIGGKVTIYGYRKA